MHYQEDFVDSGVDGSSMVGLPGDLHLFPPTANTSDVLNLAARVADVIRLPARGTVVVVLVWRDRFGASSNDYDLFLLPDSTKALVAESTDPQTGAQDPVEGFVYTNNTGANDVLNPQLLIRRQS